MKIRRADTGGETHARERAPKSISVSGSRVALTERSPPNLNATAKATGPSVLSPQSSVLAMDVAKENSAPRDERGVTTSEGAKTAKTPRARVSGAHSNIAKLLLPPRRVTRASAASTPRQMMS